MINNFENFKLKNFEIFFFHSSGHRTMKLAKQKRKISEQLAKLNELEKNVTQKKSQIEKLKTDKAITAKEIDNIESKLESTNALIEEYTVSLNFFAIKKKKSSNQE